ncbi:MAG: hypothetical protein OQJ89_10610, partial [Kangiellaceae bacterium]|nr:hypothetical protein [Kangiellaceae bacterium]
HTSVVDGFGKGLPDLVFQMGCLPHEDFPELCKMEENPDSYPGSEIDGLATGQHYVNKNYGSTIDATIGATSYRPRDMLIGITDGLGVRNEWDYLPLSSSQKPANAQDTNFDLYELDQLDTSPDNFAEFSFGSSMYVVSEFRQSNGVGGLNNVNYQYRGAVYNNQGRGFQGFRSIIIDSPSQVDSNGSIIESTRSVTNFHQRFPTAGVVESAYSCLVSDNDETCETNPLSKTETGYHFFDTTGAGTWWTFPAKSEGTTYDLHSNGTRTLNSVETSYVGEIDPGTISRLMNVDSSLFDNYGNVKTSTKKLDSGFGVSEVTTTNNYDYSLVDADWWVKLSSSVANTKKLNSTWSVYSTHGAGLDNEKEVTTSYTWTSDRNPDIVTTTPNAAKGGGKTIVVDTDYNTYVLPTKVTTSSTGETARLVDTTYSKDGLVQSADGYFPFTVTNQLNQVITTETDPKFGQPLKITGVNGNEISTTYDPFGRVEDTSASGKPIVHTRFSDCVSCEVENAVFKVTNYQAGAPDTTVYKDRLSRTLVTRIEAFEISNLIIQKVELNRLGQTIFESVPSISSSTALTSRIGTHYRNYDQIGRLAEKHTDNYSTGLTVIYNYKGYTTDIQANELSMSRIYNGSGQLLQTTDAMSGITQYAYDGSGNPIVLLDANSNPIKATYNALGQKRWVDDPNMGRKDFTYSGFGEVKTEVDANQDKIEYFYDVLGRVASREVNGTLDASFIFDTCENGKGLLCSSTSGDKTRIVIYDELSRPSQVVVSITGDDTYTTSTGYDGFYGRIKSLTYPKTGLTLAYEYNQDGYMNKLKNAADNYVYQEVNAMNAFGNITQGKTT